MERRATTSKAPRRDFGPLVVAGGLVIGVAPEGEAGRRDGTTTPGCAVFGCYSIYCKLLAITDS